MKIGIGFSVSMIQRGYEKISGSFVPVDETSCFSSGVWLMNKIFKFDTKWKMNKQ